MMSHRPAHQTPSDPRDTVGADGVCTRESAPGISSAERRNERTPGTLYIISTPIGDPDDISLRALRILNSVPLIAAENAPETRKLLAHHGVATPTRSYRPRGRADILPELLAHLEAGADLAYVCDAGTPTIADPGLQLVQSAWERRLPVRPVPGANAALAALCVSGIPTGQFAFLGTPPRSRADRAQFFQQLKSETRAILLHESQAYLRSTLQEIERALGADRLLCVAKDLTRSAEHLLRGTVAEALVHYRTRPPQGEFTLVLHPRQGEPPLLAKTLTDSSEFAE